MVFRDPCLKQGEHLRICVLNKVFIPWTSVQILFMRVKNISPSIPKFKKSHSPNLLKRNV